MEPATVVIDNGTGYLLILIFTIDIPKWDMQVTLNPLI